MSVGEEIGLQDLARSYGVQTEYVDTAGNRRETSPEVLLAVLKAMGAPIRSVRDVDEAFRARDLELQSRWIEPVAVIWEGSPAVVPMKSSGHDRPDCRLTTEQGEERAWSAPAGEEIAIPGPLPAGYHRLTVTKAGESKDCVVIVAPPRVYQGPENRSWGLFCPLYSLHRCTSWGAGDYSDLGTLIDWTADQGGSLVATLPMLASSFDETPWISPYSPASRLFGNEFYLDLKAIPDLERCEPARALMASAGFRREVNALQSARLVDYGRQMRLKRRVLEILADFALSEGAERPPAFKKFLADYPEAVAYAEFMAGAEPGGASERSVRYHLYAQWQLDTQLRALSERAEARGLTWYVDFTVGVDPKSYDVASRPHLFATEAAVGCPPDEAFTKGQNWGFPPLIPDRQREDGHAYLIAAIRSHLRYAGALRLDHVMGLHRLYWIPRGLDEGAYVTYPAEELYAILAIESHRSRSWIVGEDLGTVPAEVRPAMQRHGLRGMYVAQHALMGGGDAPLSDLPSEVVASVNTHDMPPFAAFWQGHDISERMDLGVLNPPTAAHEVESRPARLIACLNLLNRRGLLRDDQGNDLAAIQKACYELLAESPAKMILVNLEDLWLETEAQNVPGTTDQRPNWRHKLRMSFEEFEGRADVIETLRRVDALRRKAKPVSDS